MPTSKNIAPETNPWLILCNTAPSSLLHKTERHLIQLNSYYVQWICHNSFQIRLPNSRKETYILGCAQPVDKRRGKINSHQERLS
jgi:hypothetical protein